MATCEFAGRRVFEWALLLPLAMPAYIVAYAYTDYLQYAGPLQTALRDSFGWQRGDYWFPEIRSLAGAAFVFIVVLYPYVYLLARTVISGAHGGDDGRRAQPRADRVADMVARKFAAGASGDRGGCTAGVDGDDGRLRSGVVLRIADVYDLYISRVVCARRSDSRQASWRRYCSSWCWRCFMSSTERVGARDFLRQPRVSDPPHGLGSESSRQQLARSPSVRCPSRWDLSFR